MKIGTDFSGIGAPEMALKYLGINFDSIFACEIDKYARQSFEQLHNPQTFYNDITARNHKEVEQLDLYVAGFPCQTFSMAGKRKGFEETRGTLFFNVAEFIKENKPKTFILENVKGLLSHDKGRTFQTIVDILSNGGGTQNGQISLDMFEDGLGYHIYWKVLNTKNYGIPQNRERIFIVGFKDFRDFNFPKEMPLELNLGDMLQDNPNSFKLIDGFNSFQKIKYINNKVCGTITQHQSRSGLTNGFKIESNKSIEVDDKYYLSDKMIKTIFKPSKGDWKSGKMTIDTDIAKTINARVHKMGRADTDNYITVEDKYYLSDKVVKRIEDNLKEKDKENNNYQIRTHYLGGRKGDNKKGGTGHLCKTDDTSYCLDTANSQAIEIKRLPDLKIKVSKRANDTPKEINQYLKDNKKGTIKEISLYLDLPKTQVEHYFRTDNSRAIPSPEVWIKLKELLNLNSKYDKQVTEINQTIGTYESANRLYDTDGISPTLQTQEQGYYKTQNKIRRLTPLECWRLQGFKDEDFFSVKDVSDTQLYKQAGNSITVNVLMELFKKIYVNNKQT